MKRKIFIDIICALLILLFAYAALSKLADFGSFKETLKASPLIDKQALIAAWVLPITELIIVIFLFVPQLRLTGMYSSLLLLLLFTVYLIYYSISRPNELPCSCGGVISTMTWTQHIFFNIGFIFLNMIGILLSLHSTLLLQQPGSKPKTWVKE